MNKEIAQHLTGQWVRLEPLHAAHREPLRQAADHEAIWRYMVLPALGKQFDIWFDRALEGQAKGTHYPFAVYTAKQSRLIGSTRLYDLNPIDHRLAIGYTWYEPSFWGTAVNPECKWLLLRHVFETLGYQRVEFTTDTQNGHTQGALRKLGAIQEGVLRSHRQRLDGTFRDSILFSIIADEWPEVKQGLEARLAEFVAL